MHFLETESENRAKISKTTIQRENMRAVESCGRVLVPPLPSQSCFKSTDATFNCHHCSVAHHVMLKMHSVNVKC